MVEEQSRSDRSPMLFLVIVTALWAYRAVRMVRGRLTSPAVERPHPGPPTSERWSRIDDIQLTRLLRHAANGD
jgi:hypothetical protein